MERAGSSRLEMTKWVSGESEPASGDIYAQNEGTNDCSCASFKRPCKHIPIQKALLGSGVSLHRIAYDLDAQTIVALDDIP
jgi:hypothetical protein